MHDISGGKTDREGPALRAEQREMHISFLRAGSRRHCHGDAVQQARLRVRLTALAFRASTTGAMHTRGFPWAQRACHHQNYIVLPGGAYRVGQALVQAAIPRWRHDRVPTRGSATYSGEANWKNMGSADGRSLPNLRGLTHVEIAKI